MNGGPLSVSPVSGSGNGGDGVARQPVLVSPARAVKGTNHFVRSFLFAPYTCSFTYAYAFAVCTYDFHFCRAPQSPTAW